MIKFILLFSLILGSLSAFSQDCANSVAKLKTLVRDEGLSSKWHENTKKNALTVNLKDVNGNLVITIKNGSQLWANVTGVVCKKGSNFAARVGNIEWGSAAPGLAKSSKIKEIGMKFPYPSVMKISVSLMSLEFSAL